MIKPKVKASVNFTQWELEEMLDKLIIDNGKQVTVRVYAVQSKDKQIIELTVTVGANN